MKQRSTRILSVLLAILLFCSVLLPCSFAATAEEWDENWDRLKNDASAVSMSPGSDPSSMNFTWLSPTKDCVVMFEIATDSSMKNGKFLKVERTHTVLYGWKNDVTAENLKSNTAYYYRVAENGKWSKTYSFNTGSNKEYNVLFVSDTQIGRSGDRKLDEVLKHDSLGWNNTLEAAVKYEPDISLIISAGDQVNKTGKPKEEEYAAYLDSEVLSGLAVATTIGNHDSLNEDYMYHFNNPNATEYGTTAAGGDYYYSYGDGLFIVLNTNNYNVAEHQKAIEEAVASDPDAAWRIVTMHQDIYGTGLDHSDTDGMILRTQLTPIFDANDIDVVLQGHDHTYSRSKMLYGDGQTHGKYEFSLTEDGSDYDWEHATNTETGEKIQLNPEEGDEEATAALDAFQQDNLCYTIEDVEGNSVTDPEGILYLTANSASGSKFYELIAQQQDYIAARSQNWLPSYSIITLTKDTFSVDAYQITDDGNVETIDDTFTITKTK